MADFGARFTIGGGRHDGSYWVVSVCCPPIVYPFAESRGVGGRIGVTPRGCPYC